MKRRTYLAGVAAAGALAGCLGNGGGDGSDGATDGDGSSTDLETTASAEYETNGEFPPDGDSADGYPPEFDEVPDQREIDTSAFETVTQDGVEVPLAPADAVHYWYRRGEARIADARGREQYDTSHVFGAVLSPAGRGGSDGDPVVEWPQDDRIVCYCGCPHHLSSIRAASLIDAGYENVYVIDEGFWEWHAQDYPMAGTDLSVSPYGHVVRGRADPGFAGETAWARHEPSGQREATTIGDDGGYSMTLRFVDVDRDSPIRVETPGYEVEAPLGRLVDTTVTADLG
ncbi:rhodanese-like domain-containing protein [Halostella litorea]|uniref:rhodanese-like domain-containing protein n=1 Tax=Halostella litorea TaxID=2528831 RepID=UPI0010925986|nr:rhodanese-like domain-containing protein [Halostella litorea]